jgi:hypothetical protein
MPTRTRDFAPAIPPLTFASSGRSRRQQIRLLCSGSGGRVGKGYSENHVTALAPLDQALCTGFSPLEA